MTPREQAIERFIKAGGVWPPLRKVPTYAWVDTGRWAPIQRRWVPVERWAAIRRWAS